MLKQSIRTAILGLGLFVGGFFSSLRGATIVISPSDNINTVLAGLKPGDTLQLHGGSYPVINNTTIKGTSVARITIMSFPGETAVVNGMAVNGGLTTKF